MFRFFFVLFALLYSITGEHFFRRTSPPPAAAVATDAAAAAAAVAAAAGRGWCSWEGLTSALEKAANIFPRVLTHFSVTKKILEPLSPAPVPKELSAACACWSAGAAAAAAAETAASGSAAAASAANGWGKEVRENCLRTPTGIRCSCRRPKTKKTTVII